MIINQVLFDLQQEKTVSKEVQNNYFSYTHSK